MDARSGGGGGVSLPRRSPPSLSQAWRSATSAASAVAALENERSFVPTVRADAVLMPTDGRLVARVFTACSASGLPSACVRHYFCVVA
jgi:hypothetical protein